jgi:hypothetical protein
MPGSEEPGEATPAAKPATADPREREGASRSMWTKTPLARTDREDMMLERLDRRDRLRLVEFVCSFAWADFEIRPEERAFISRLISRLELDDDENLQVQQWLERPPRLDDLDPTSIPAAHRRIFVETVEELILADGEVAEEERDSLEIFKGLLVD